MPNRNNTSNINLWLEQSGIDYFSHFVKAWIPFNAWYRQNYSLLEKERDILDQIKLDGNKIRSRFIARLEGTDPDAEQMRNHIASLHRRLSVDPLIDAKNRRISFENVCIGSNTTLIGATSFYGYRYIATRQRNPIPQVECQILNRKGAVVSTFIHASEWDIDSFKLISDFASLHPDNQSRILLCYEQVNPYLFSSLLAVSSDRHPLLMDAYKFVNDKPAIFAGLVEILYAMRNMLFHGELVPDPQANRTYEPAYHLLRHLVSFIT